MTNSFNWTSTFGSSQDPGIERRDRETLEREKELQRLIEDEKEEEQILTDNAGRIRQKDLEENPPLENLEYQGLETKSEHWLLKSLGWVGDRFDDLDRAAGVGEFNVYNARQKILKPLSETHVALGILGEFFIPDTVDIATLGFSYIPKRFAKIPKVWAKLVRAANPDAVRTILRGDDMLVDAATGMRINAGDFSGIDDLAKQSAQPMRMTLDPKGLQNWGSNKRKAGAKFITGNKIQDESAFIQGGWEVFTKISSQFGIDINRGTSPLQIHHKGVVRQIAESLNGLTDDAAKAGGDLLSKKLGYPLGYDPKNAAPVPAKFHQRVHDIINDHVAIRWGDNLKGLEQKLNLPSNWKTTMDLQARIDAGIYDEIADGIKESTDAIDTFWKSVSTRTNLGKLTEDEFIDATLEVVELDKRLSTLQRTRQLSPEEGYTATQAVNEILEKAGRVDLQSPIFDKLDPDMSKELVKILIQRNGEKALREVLTTGKDTESVFKAYKLSTKGYDKLFSQLNLPGFTNIKDPTAGKPLGRPKGSTTKTRRKKVKSKQEELTVEWTREELSKLLNDLIANE